MSDKIISIGNIYYGEYHAGFGGNIVGIDGIAPTLLGGGNKMPLILIEDEREKTDRWQEPENHTSK